MVGETKSRFDADLEKQEHAAAEEKNLAELMKAIGLDAKYRIILKDFDDHPERHTPRLTGQFFSEMKGYTRLLERALEENDKGKIHELSKNIEDCIDWIGKMTGVEKKWSRSTDQ